MSFVFNNVFLFLQELLLWYFYLHTMPDLPFFILFQILSILQNSVLLEYCLILQNKHLVFTESKENARPCM